MTSHSLKEGSQTRISDPSSHPLDMLALAKEPRLVSQLHPNQKIIYSCWIEKFNETNKCQARIFLLTDSAIYNLIKSQNFIKSIFSKLVAFQNKFTIRRKIPFSSIDAITLSNLEGNNEFVLHVHDDYDYRFKIPDYKMKINLLKSICLQYEKNIKKKMAFYFVDDITLINYCTFKSDTKKKKSKKPNSGAVHLNVEDLIDYELPGVQFELVYSKEKDNVDIEGFKSSSLEMIKENRKYFTLQTLQIKYSSLEDKMQNEHPFILLPCYCFETSLHTYLLRPLMTGGILQKIMVENGTFNRKLVTFYIAQIIIGLEFLHERKWIYKVLSLRKIYLKSNGYIALEGLCRGMTRKKEQKMFDLSGNYNYFPPEVILSEGYDEKIDIWCLGILTFELVYGHHPFAVQNSKQTFRNILQLEIQKSDQLPAFVYRALEKKPEKRITLSEIKKDEWFTEIDWEMIEGEKIGAPYVADLQKINEWEGKLPTVVYLEQSN